LKHFCVKFGDPSCIGFRDILRTTDRHRQVEVKTYPLDRRRHR